VWRDIWGSFGAPRIGAPRIGSGVVPFDVRQHAVVGVDAAPQHDRSPIETTWSKPLPKPA
jgi:hypothetical protein